MSEELIDRMQSAVDEEPELLGERRLGILQDLLMNWHRHGRLSDAQETLAGDLLDEAGCA